MATLKSFVWDDERKELTARAHDVMENVIIPFDKLHESKEITSAISILTALIQAEIDKRLSLPKQDK